MAERPTVIVIKEGPIASLVRDAGTFALLTSLIGLGVYVESSAMQWVGAFVAFTFILGRGLGSRRFMTIDEARARLDELEEGTSHG